MRRIAIQISLHTIHLVHMHMLVRFVLIEIDSIANTYVLSKSVKRVICIWESTENKKYSLCLCGFYCFMHASHSTSNTHIHTYYKPNNSIYTYELNALLMNEAYPVHIHLYWIVNMHSKLFDSTERINCNSIIYRHMRQTHIHPHTHNSKLHERDMNRIL